MSEPGLTSDRFTVRAGEMSEPGSPSDKIISKSRRNVRTWSDFGQSHREELVKCPNLI
ncbi:MULTISPECIES: hypothetical protein [unclassified Mesobacillus]|uniref:hypothetical protein n=1 Tax=unclassified Mesobacillus TaxID=2675270 RepID=UPI002040B6AC|nr:MULTISPECIES: hypothetical protein [unclassified Mesobacillus]MCM3125233.1 hypothetical protein [Mesobacillus sp. MER 33]MCM3235336.1 hypothetical protein [Mesobacillus sp. MER 48]